MPPSPPTDREGFEIAIICAPTIEADAVHDVFDIFWEDQGYHYGRVLGDHNCYTTGVIGSHNVVLAYAEKGSVSASAIAASLKLSFPSIQLALVVGICGGVPCPSQQDNEIFLGDLVISTSIVQYDLGRQYHAFFQQDNTLENVPGRLNHKVRGLLTKLKTRRYRQIMERDMITCLQEVISKVPTASYPGHANDHLYQSSYLHKHRPRSDSIGCDVCGREGETICTVAIKSTCKQLGCEPTYLVPRNRPSNFGLLEQTTLSPCPKVHFGRIGSANMVMKSGKHRDELAHSHNVVALEMEGAGVWDYIPSLVMKGVSDYADSHKGDHWQLHAAAVAAAGMKAFLDQWNKADALSSGVTLGMTPQIKQATRDLSANPLRLYPETVNPVQSQFLKPTSQMKKDQFTSEANPLLDSTISRVKSTPNLNERKSSVATEVGRTANLRVKTRLSVLRNPEEAVVDVVFVHSECKDLREQWGRGSDRSFWLQADEFWDQELMAHARVFGLEYIPSFDDFDKDVGPLVIGENLPSEMCSGLRDALNSTSKQNDESRPIVFVTYGLGGWILLSALSMEGNYIKPWADRRYNVCGALFINVPDTMTSSMFEPKFLGTSIDHNPELFISNLGIRSVNRTLDLQKLNVRCFREAAANEGLSNISVRKSFTFNLPTEQTTILAGIRGLEMCRFDKQDQHFELIRKAILGLVSGASFWNIFGIHNFKKNSLLHAWFFDQVSSKLLDTYSSLWHELCTNYGINGFIKLNELIQFFKSQAFNPPAPDGVEIAHVWAMIVRAWQVNEPGIVMKDSDYDRVGFPQSLVMTVLYMLHVAKRFPGVKDLDRAQFWLEISKRQWQQITRLNIWIPCTCGTFTKESCEKTWNFVCSPGILRSFPSRSGKSTQSCPLTLFPFSPGDRWSHEMLKYRSVLAKNSTIRKISSHQGEWWRDLHLDDPQSSMSKAICLVDIPPGLTLDQVQAVITLCLNEAVWSKQEPHFPRLLD